MLRSLSAKKTQHPTGHRTRSHIKECHASKHHIPPAHKNFLRLLLFALCGFAGTTFADDFKSMTIAGGTSSDPIRVHGDQFMVIRNFTQEGGSDRGFVMVTKLPSGDTANILTAAILDTTTTPPDVINNVVIAGPADITVTCGTGATGCFISYKKDSN
jgi:hypothetical protein